MSYLEGTIKMPFNEHKRRIDDGVLEQVFPKHIADALREGRSVGASGMACAAGIAGVAARSPS